MSIITYLRDGPYNKVIRYVVAHWRWVAGIVLVALGLAAGGYAYYLAEVHHIRRDKYQEIAAIADLKAKQIQQWRNERLADALKTAQSPLFKEAVAQWLTDPAAPGLRLALKQRLNLERMGDRYADALLLDTGGRMLLSAGARPDPVDAAARRAIKAALASRTAVLSDLYRYPHDIVHIDAAAPIQNAEGRPMAVVLLHSNAEEFLYPLIQSWPTPSRTAETLLVCREGETILFLNELRHQADTALTLREPLTRLDLPAVQAVLGKQGMFQGRDYRGVQVLGDLRPVAQTPWFMVTKADTDEILAEVRYRAGAIILFCLLSILLVGGMIAHIYRSRQEAQRRGAERELRESEERFRLAFENANSGVCLVDLEGNLTRVNNKMCEIFGYSRKELERMTVNDIAHPEDIDKSPEFIKKTLQGKIDRATFEKRYFHKKGQGVTCDVSSSLVRNTEGSPLYFISHVQDITARKQAEARAEHLKFVLFAIRGVNQLITQEQDRNRLIQGVCDKLIETRGYDNVWIALIDESGKVVATSQAGLDERFPPLVEQLMRGELSYCMRMGLTQAGALIIDDPVATCTDCSLSTGYGGRKGMATRLEHDGKIYGLMTVSISGDYVVDEEEQTLFEEVAGDVAFALYSMELEEKRTQAEEAVRESEERFRKVVETMGVGMATIDENGVSTYVNEYFSKMLGCAVDEMIGRPILDFFYNEEGRQAQKEVFARRRAGKQDPTPYEVTWKKKDGQMVYAIVSPTPMFDAGGRYTGSFAIHTDITERKKAEEKLREMLITTINALASMVEMKDQYTAGHQPRVTHLACAIAGEMGLSEEQIEGIRMAGSVHDIGKTVVPAEILNKPGPLTKMQYEMVKMHPRAGYDILKKITFPWPVAQIVLQHHELMDGSGYPQGLSGEEIMLEARILTVANVVEAMTSHRPYRAAYEIKEALEEISNNRGVLYDPAVVDACLMLFERGFSYS